MALYFVNSLTAFYCNECIHEDLNETAIEFCVDHALGIQQSRCSLDVVRILSNLIHIDPSSYD